MTVFEQIGQKLRNARESRGLTVGQIYDKTKISTANLEAIENGDIDQLPEPVYVSGFIKRYAECVGLNGQNLTEEFRRASDELEDRSEKSGFGGWGGKAVAVQQQPIVHSSLSKAKLAPPKPSIAKLVFYPAFLIVIIVGLISYLFYYQTEQIKRKAPSLQSLEATTSGYSPATLPSKPSASDEKVAEEDKPKSSEDSKVVLSASKHVWVEVRALSTGNSVFTGYLEAGDRRDYVDSQGLRIRAGNGGSLTVSYQGKKETFGEAGHPKTRTFATEDAASSTEAASASEDKPAASTTAAPRPAPKPKKVVKADPKPKPAPSIRRASPSRYIPGESLGGSRSISVPYRYTE